MTDAWSTDDLEALREGWDFEAKRAAGRDGTGEVPRAFWETYSAMANARGGQIVLGVKERQDGTLVVHGLGDPDRVERDLWNCLSDRGKVSVNLLGEKDVEQQVVGGKTILVVHVPRAPREARPVFLNDQWDQAFVRVGEGDRKLDRERVRRMLADAEHDTRDDRVLPHLGLADLDQESVKRYRNLFRVYNGGHPWNDLDDEEFFRQLRALGQDSETGRTGLTVAGLLLLGQEPSICTVLPHYFVDYQERVALDDVTQWEDRLVPDGRWSGNVLDFFLRVTRKLVADLKVPFQLEDGLTRRDDTHVHEAVREALVNCLVHADYQGRHRIRVVKTSGAFLFENPGVMRLPVDEVRAGGRSDCRNQILQRMFRLVGFGENAGSGFSRILRAWREQHWRVPLIEENIELDLTTLHLSMTSLLPAEVVEALEGRFGNEFTSLDETSRLAVAMAARDGRVTNRALQEVTDVHPRDLTFLLGKLVDRRLLDRHGDRQGAWYTVAGTPVTTEQQILPQTLPQTPPQTSPQTSPQSLEAVVSAIAESRWATRTRVEGAILALCTGQYVTVRELAARLGRSRRTISQNYVSRLVADGRLILREPDNPASAMQAYRTAESAEEPTE